MLPWLRSHRLALSTTFGLVSHHVDWCTRNADISYPAKQDTRIYAKTDQASTMDLQSNTAMEEMDSVLDLTNPTLELFTDIKEEPSQTGTTEAMDASIDQSVDTR